MKQLEELRKTLHDKILRLRNLSTLLNTSLMLERLWLDSDEETRAELEVAVLLEDKDYVIKWMKNHKSIDLGELPHAKLRDLARALHIQNYSRHPRYVLVSLIKQKEKENEEARLVAAANGRLGSAVQETQDRT